MSPDLPSLSDRPLDAVEINVAMRTLLDPSVADAAKAEFLTAWARRGETAAELAHCAQALLPGAVDPGLRGSFRGRLLLDCCGTGGGGLPLFNVSTGLMFILAALEIPVVKHGNRGLTKKSGSADVLEALGLRIDLPPEEVPRCMDEVGLRVSLRARLSSRLLRHQPGAPPPRRQRPAHDLQSSRSAPQSRAARGAARRRFPRRPCRALQRSARRDGLSPLHRRLRLRCRHQKSPRRSKRERPHHAGRFSARTSRRAAKTFRMFVAAARNPLRPKRRRKRATSHRPAFRKGKWPRPRPPHSQRRRRRRHSRRGRHARASHRPRRRRDRFGPRNANASSVGKNFPPVRKPSHVQISLRLDGPFLPLRLQRRRTGAGVASREN